jgi:hypothetical protein
MKLLALVRRPSCGRAIAGALVADSGRGGIAGADRKSTQCRDMIAEGPQNVSRWPYHHSHWLMAKERH